MDLLLKMQFSVVALPLAHSQIKDVLDIANGFRAQHLGAQEFVNSSMELPLKFAAHRQYAEFANDGSH